MNCWNLSTTPLCTSQIKGILCDRLGISNLLLITFDWKYAWISRRWARLCSDCCGMLRSHRSWESSRKLEIFGRVMFWRSRASGCCELVCARVLMLGIKIKVLWWLGNWPMLIFSWAGPAVYLFIWVSNCNWTAITIIFFPI